MSYTNWPDFLPRKLTNYPTRGRNSNDKCYIGTTKLFEDIWRWTFKGKNMGYVHLYDLI